MSHRRRASSRSMFLGASLWLAALSPALVGCKDKAEKPQEVVKQTVPLSWAVGEDHFYDVTLSTKTSNGASPVPVELTLKGRLELRFDQAGAERQFVGALKDVQLLDRSGRAYDEAGLLSAELELPFGAVLEAGLIKEYRTPNEGTINSMGFHRQILAALQLQEGPDAAGLTEWDATGLAKVAYEKGASDKEWSWKKLGYEKITVTRTGAAADERQQVQPEIQRAEGRLLLDERGIAEVVRDEATRVKVADNAYFSTQTKLTLKRVAVAPAGRGLLPWKQLVDETTGVPAGQGAPIKSAALVEQVKRGDLELEDVLKILQEVKAKEDRSAGDIRQQASAFRALVAMIRTDDKARKVVLDLVEEGGPSSPVLLDALGSSSSPFGITVLSQLAVNKKVDSEKRSQAAMALLRVQWPNQEALDAVTALTKEAAFREAGMLGLGSFARRFREAGERGLNEAAVVRLEAELKVELKKKSPPPYALLAVANSAESRFFDLVKPFQEHPKREVRDAAFQALRLMKDERVEPLLAEALKSESASDLRAALQAFRPRKTENKAIVKRVVELALEHKEPLVRREAVLVIKKWQPDYPELEATLEQVRATDKDKRVLREAG
jgi:hypothetical protein